MLVVQHEGGSACPGNYHQDTTSPQHPTDPTGHKQVAFAVNRHRDAASPHRSMSTTLPSSQVQWASTFLELNLFVRETGIHWSDGAHLTRHKSLNESFP